MCIERPLRAVLFLAADDWRLQQCLRHAVQLLALMQAFSFAREESHARELAAQRPAVAASHLPNACRSWAHGSGSAAGPGMDGGRAAQRAMSNNLRFNTISLVADESHKSAFSLIVVPSAVSIIWTRVPVLFRRSEFFTATISACAHFVNISD